MRSSGLGLVRMTQVTAIALALALVAGLPLAAPASVAADDDERWQQVELAPLPSSIELQASEIDGLGIPVDATFRPRDEFDARIFNRRYFGERDKRVERLPPTGP